MTNDLRRWMTLMYEAGMKSSDNDMEVKIQKFSKYIEQKYSNLHHLAIYWSIEHKIRLGSIAAKDKKQGTGSAVMRELCDFADRLKVPINVTPFPQIEHGSTSLKRLRIFYSRFGFKPSEFGTMERQPNE